MKSKSGGKFVIALIIAYLLLPLALTLIYSLFTEWMDILPSGFTLRYYAEIFADPIFWASLARTVVISFIPVFITAVVLLLAMYAVVLYMPALDKYLQIICTIPYAIQGVILPVSVLSLYAGAPAPFSNRIVMLVLTYCVVILPYMYQGIKNSLVSVDAARLVEAAEMLGADKFYAFLRVLQDNRPLYALGRRHSLDALDSAHLRGLCNRQHDRRQLLLYGADVPAEENVHLGPAHERRNHGAIRRDAADFGGGVLLQVEDGGRRGKEIKI